MINFTDHSKTKPVDTQASRKQNKPALQKYHSEPKFTSLKEEILKIPKVKQILQKDKLVYLQDIEKRVELLGNVKNQNFLESQKINLHELGKRLQKKKTKRHKTNFKIPLTRKNMQSLNNLVKDHISLNQFFKNQEKVYLKDYEANAPFNLQKLKFMDELNPIKQRYKQKFPDFKQGVLAKNKLTLQHVILNRNIKREMKLDQQRLSKQKAKRIFQSLK